MATGFWDQYRKKTTQPATQARPYPSSFSLSNQSGIPTRTGTQVTASQPGIQTRTGTAVTAQPAPARNSMTAAGGPGAATVPPRGRGAVLPGAGQIAEENDARAWLQNALDFLQGGRRDTAADRAAIENRVNMQSREALMNNQAALGAAGFGQSGALVGLDAGIRADAAQRILEMQNQLERDADREYLDRIGSALDYDMRERGLAQDEAAQSRLFDLISELYGDGTAAGAAGAAGGGGELPFGARVWDNGGATPDDGRPTGRTIEKDGMIYEEWEGVGLFGAAGGTVWVPRAKRTDEERQYNADATARFMGGA